MEPAGQDVEKECFMNPWGKRKLKINPPVADKSVKFKIVEWKTDFMDPEGGRKYGQKKIPAPIISPPCKIIAKCAVLGYSYMLWKKVKSTVFRTKNFEGNRNGKNKNAS